jgi:hypothetical protein
MAWYIGKTTSPRHGFVFYEIPTMKGSMYGGSITPIEWRDYGPVLDSVFEMADALVSCNGITPQQAVEQACKDERWRLTPNHKRMIVQRLEQA